MDDGTMRNARAAAGVTGASGAKDASGANGMPGANGTPGIGGAVADAAFTPDAPLDRVCRAIVRRLAAAGVDTPAWDARQLLAGMLGMDASRYDMAAITGVTLGRAAADAAGTDVAFADVAAALEDAVRRREAREPLQYILGVAPFRYLELKVGPGVFIPRPETELIVEAGLDWLRALADGASRPLVVDLCAGSGAVGLAIATEAPNSRVVAVEMDRAAAVWTRRNERHVRHAHPDIDYTLTIGDATAPGTLAELDGTVDLVVTNPPYVPLGAIPEQPEVRDHDPELALYGGSADGLRIPKAIVDRACALLRAHGSALVMEHDVTQGDALVDYALAHGFDHAVCRNDLTGRPRYLFARR